MNNFLNAEQRGHVQTLLDTMQEQTALLQSLIADGYTPALHDALKLEATHGYDAAYTPVKSSKLLGILNDFKNGENEAAAENAYYVLLAEADRAADALVAQLEQDAEEQTDEGDQDTESADYFAAQSERIANARARARR